MGGQERQTRQDRAGSSAHPGCPEGARRRCPGTAQAVPGNRAGILRRPEAELHPRLTESPIHRPGTNVLLSSATGAAFMLLISDFGPYPLSCGAPTEQISPLYC